jgi:hypothetical protein
MPNLGNINPQASRQNSNPMLTQNQSAFTPYGSGTQNDDDIPNVTKKVQYTAEGNDPFSQLISAGDQLIQDAGQNFGRGEINPNHYDVISRAVDMKRGLQDMPSAYKREQNIIRPHTQNENLDNSFVQNIGDTSQLNHSDGRDTGSPFADRMMRVGLAPQSEDDETLPDQKRYQASVVSPIVKTPTTELVNQYEAQLARARNGDLRDNDHEIHVLRTMHNELARRGIDTLIFNNDVDSRERLDTVRAQELADHRRRLHIFHERSGAFHNRTAEYGRRTPDEEFSSDFGADPLSDVGARPAAPPAPVDNPDEPSGFNDFDEYEGLPHVDLWPPRQRPWYTRAADAISDAGHRLMNWARRGPPEDDSDEAFARFRLPRDNETPLLANYRQDDDGVLRPIDDGLQQPLPRDNARRPNPQVPPIDDANELEDIGEPDDRVQLDRGRDEVPHAEISRPRRAWNAMREWDKGLLDRIRRRPARRDEDSATFGHEMDEDDLLGGTPEEEDMDEDEFNANIRRLMRELNDEDNDEDNEWE